MNRNVFLIFISFIFLSSCIRQQRVSKKIKPASTEQEINNDSLEIIAFYQANESTHGTSQSQGSVSNGKLNNGKLFPFYGPNFQYFDADSYFAYRAYTHGTVQEIILDSYRELQIQEPTRFFYIMELSHKEGGAIYPHRTHQNGLSADFMIPKLKDGQAYNGLDTLGKDHYFLSFNDNGEYTEDTSIIVDFNLIAKHLLILQEKANLHGYKLSKVILKIEFKDELFATPYGKLLKNSGIYFAQNLTPLVNNLHDDHYHVDFEK